MEKISDGENDGEKPDPKRHRNQTSGGHLQSLLRRVSRKARDLRRILPKRVDSQTTDPKDLQEGLHQLNEGALSNNILGVLDRIEATKIGRDCLQSEELPTWAYDAKSAAPKAAARIGALTRAKV